MPMTTVAQYKILADAQCILSTKVVPLVSEYSISRLGIPLVELRAGSSGLVLIAQAVHPFSLLIAGKNSPP